MAFGAIYLIWGSTFLAIRWAIETLPPFFVAGVQSALGGIVLYGWSLSRDRASPASAHWRDATIVGSLMLAGGVGGITWAEQRVSSGSAALLIATVPLWMSVLDWVHYGGPPPRGRTVLALTAGLGGVALLVRPKDLQGAGDIDAVGAAVLLLASLSWAEGSLFSRRARRPEAPLLATAMQMLSGGALLLVAGWALGEWESARIGRISVRSLLALAYLTLFGSIIAFTAYIWLLRVVPPSRVSTYAFVNPVVALLLGWMTGDEAVTARTTLAAGMIVTAVVLIVMQEPRAPADVAGPRPAGTTGQGG